MTIELERASAVAPRPEADWERDWNGRPKILPDPTWTPEQTAAWQGDRADEEGRVCYTRVTTFAEALQDASALSRWKMRRVALGMGVRPDYVTAAAALSTEDRDKAALDDLAEKALEASGPNAADVGTAVHSFTERLDRGEPLGAVPEAYRADVEAYARVVAHLRFVEWECRTVCDELEVAGTPDRLGFCDVPDPDGIVDELRIIDTKTGKVDYSAGKFSTQLAIYRRSELYDPVTGARTSYEDRHGAPVSRWGLIVHVPAGSGRAELLWLDLSHGWDGAELAAQVRQWRTGATGTALLRPVFARAPRPTPANGTCRGRLQTGAACVYRAKDGTQWCGRHQSQQAELDRWLAENPGVDPDGGEDATVAPAQPATPAVDPARVQAAADASVADQLARRDRLAQLRDEADDAADRVNAEQERLAETGPDMAQAADELEALVAMAPLAEQETGPHGYPAGSVAEAAEADQRASYEAEKTRRCPTTDLLVEQCACPVHRPDLAETADLIVGTYALDPDREINGNPRPVSGLRTPDDVLEQADATARRRALRMIELAQSESELLLIYRQHQDLWTPELTAAAGARSAELAEQQARERPEAALLAAIRTAPDVETIRTLWQQHRGGLWIREHSAAADVRHGELGRASAATVGGG